MNVENKIEFFANYNPAWDQYDLYSRKTENGIRTYASSICYISREVGTISSPLLQLTKKEAQNMLQALWDAGIRPQQESSLGQLAAVNYHLEDMRKLVFGKDM